MSEDAHKTPGTVPDLETYPLNRAPEKPVNKITPSHYKGDYVMRVIEDFDLDFKLGNVVKYICRHGAKAGLEDLKKAQWYLNRAIEHMEHGATLLNPPVCQHLRQEYRGSGTNVCLDCGDTMDASTGKPYVRKS